LTAADISMRRASITAVLRIHCGCLLQASLVPTLHLVSEDPWICPQREVEV
jgi:hypothetical protein